MSLPRSPIAKLKRSISTDDNPPGLNIDESKKDGVINGTKDGSNARAFIELAISPIVKSKRSISTDDNPAALNIDESKKDGVINGTKDGSDARAPHHNTDKRTVEYELMRRTFNIQAFGTAFEDLEESNIDDLEESNISSLDKTKNSKLRTREGIKYMIYVLCHWETGNDEFSKESFRKKHLNGYTWSGKYSVKSRGNDSYYVVGKEGRGAREVIAAEDIFDVIYDAHEHVSHLKVAPTYNQIKKTYHSVTEKQVKLYIQNICTICNLTRRKRKAKKGASNPIISLQYRSRFQADLIDFRHDSRVDHNGVEMKWILVLKDHFTKFTWLRTLKAKEAKLVRVELLRLFSEVGWPLIFHSDNGGEFVGAIVREILDSNAFVCTVTGRPRTPSDQGSVERVNQEVKKVIDHLIAMAKEKGEEDPSWVDMIPQTTSTINNAVSYGNAQLTPYNHVFGMDYDCPILPMPLDHMAKLKTVQDLATYAQDEGLTEMLKEQGYNVTKMLDFKEANLKSDTSATMMGQSNDTSEGNADDVTKMLDFKEANLKSDTSATMVGQSNDTFEGNADDVTKMLDFKEANLKSDTSVTMVGQSNDISEGNADDVFFDADDKEEDNHDHLEEVDEEEDYDDIPSGDIVVAAAAAVVDDVILEFNFDLADLCCEVCKFGQTNIQMVSIGETDYYDYCERNAFCWWEINFLYLFGVLMSHAAHSDKRMFLDCTAPNMMSEPKPITLNNKVETIVCVAWAQSHYAVLEFVLDEKIVNVYDGLGKKLELWNNHTGYILKQIGEECDDWSIEHLELFQNRRVTQQDSWNCGPIACMVLWGLFNPTTAFAAQWESKNSVSSFRSAVVNETKRCLAQSKDLFHIRKGRKSRDDEPMLCGIVSTVNKRKVADEKRKYIVDKQASKMKRHRGECVTVKLGDIVRIRVPKVDRAPCKSLDLLGVVIQVRENTKTVSVATRHGMISQGKKGSDNKSQHFLSPDQYEVIQDVPVLHKGLIAIRNHVVRDGDDFDIKHLECISMRTAHQNEYGSPRKKVRESKKLPKWGNSKCSCKVMCDPKRCGCLKEDSFVDPDVSAMGHAIKI